MRHLTAWRDWRRWIPAECPGCGRRQPGQHLCRACRAALAWDWAVPRCQRCLHPLLGRQCPDCASGPPPACDGMVAAFEYAGLGRALIREYKFHQRLSLAAVLADHLAQAVRQSGVLQCPPDWIVPVPARRQAVQARGFSPPAEVARLLARQLGLRYRLDGVRRLGDGPRQTRLGRAERLTAQQGRYVGHSSVARACRVAVVDDVLTTGATMQAVANALKTAGAAHVQGWVLGRTVSARSRQAPL